MTVAGTLLTDAPSARPNGDRITIGHLNAQSRSVDVDALGAYLERTKPDVFVVLDPLQSDVPQFRRSAPGFTETATGSAPGAAVELRAGGGAEPASRSPASATHPTVPSGRRRSR